MSKLVKRMPKAAQRRAGGRTEKRAAGPLLPLLGGYGGGTTAGEWVTPQSALSVTAYYAGVRVLSEDAASLPLEVFRRKGDSRKVVREHPLYEKLNGSPDGMVNDMNFRESMIAHCLGWGNGFAEIEWDQGATVVQKLHLLHPGTTRVEEKGGRLRYTIDTQDGPRNLEQEDVWHLAGMGFNGIQGYSPVALAKEALGLAKGAEKFGAALFGNGAVPKGVIEFPNALGDEAFERFRRSFNEVHQGSENANKIAIIEEGGKFTPTQINPDDAQFLATRAFQVIEIARILRLPPHKLGDYSQSHLANIEASNLDYLVTSLRPWLVRIEKSATLRLFTEKERRQGYYLRHDMRALLRAASKDRAEYYTRLRDLGVLSPDEIRELEDLNPVGESEGGNLRLVPVNMQSLKNAGKPPEGNENSGGSDHISQDSADDNSGGTNADESK